MKELLFRNRLILYLGVSLRYFLLRVIRRRNVDFHSLLYGIKCPNDKEEETFNISNEFTNRLYAITFIVLIVIVIALVQMKSNDISVDNAKHNDSQVQKLHSATKTVRQKFSALDSFSKSKKSALRICHGLNIKRYIKESNKIANWVEIMEYPPTVYLCDNGNYFFVARTKNPTGRDTNFYHWMILGNDGRVIADMVSFSKNINNCFRKDGKIHMLIYDYADEYFYKEQSELIPIVERDFIIDNTLVMNKERKFFVEEN